MSDPLRVLLLSGSLSNPSHTGVLLENLALLLREQGAIAYAWDLHFRLLPTPNLVYYGHALAHESKIVQQLAQSADQADAFVLGTPIYHNSFSGILKNALDHLHANQFRHKPIAVISNGRERATGQSCDQLRIVAQSLSAIVIPTQIVTSDADFGLYQGNYIVISPRIEKLLIRIADELIEYSLLMRQFRESIP
jgi:azobenzene reductase